jgi:hypothetical protein
MVLKDFEQNGYDFGVSVQEIRHYVLRELTDNIGCSLPYYFTLILHTMHKNLSE